MNQRNNALRSLSPWLLAIYFIASTWVGIILLSIVLREGDRSFLTLIMILSLVIGCFIHHWIDRIGHTLGGYLSGLHMLMRRTGKKDRVLERGQMKKRQLSLETDIFPVIMGPRSGKKGRFGLYMCGGPLLNLVVVFAAYWILYLAIVPINSYIGTFLMALCLSGLWTFAFSMFPAYIGYSPNDGLNMWTFYHNKMARESFFQDLKILEVLSDPTFMDDEHSVHVPNLDEDDDINVMTTFRTAYLLRSYELQMWTGHKDIASEILSVLYYHLDDFSDEWQIHIMEEAVFCLCLGGTAEENDLADRLITPGRRKVYERSMTPVAYKALLLWSLHHVEMKKDTVRYYQSFDKKSQEIPFETARRSWIKLIRSLPVDPAIK